MRSMADILFEPLRFRNLTVKNRIFRSNISGRFDNYDGSGNQARINWETKFARGGVGAIISSFVPVHIHGRIMPNYATIDRDERIPFWRKVGEAVHHYDCKVHPAAQSRRTASATSPASSTTRDRAPRARPIRCTDSSARR
jgi:2,4-dienoyl-CoA reductase-like NADH-dependent reductase (Old Yellow Enzyme family)